jgi:hypothetical protein
MEAITVSGIDYTIFFYNPNINSQKEYLLRKDENIRFTEQHGVPFNQSHDAISQAKQIIEPVGDEAPAIIRNVKKTRSSVTRRYGRVVAYAHTDIYQRESHSFIRLDDLRQGKQP